MKINSTIIISVLGKDSKISATTGKANFSLAILQGTEAGNMGCTEDVYNVVKPLHTYSVQATYDDKYQYMRITGVDPKSEKSMHA